MTVDTTCQDRLRVLADDPAYAAIRGELLHAVAELDGMHDLLGSLLTLEGWYTANGYVSQGPCHGCGADVWMRKE